MPDAKKTSVGKPKIGGAVFRAPVGTALPTDATSKLDVAFKELGYCSEDGLTNSNSPETSSQKAWGGDTVLNMQTGRPDKFKTKLLEVLNEEVLKTVYGDDNVSGTLSEGIKVAVNSNEMEAYSWVFEMALKKAVKRIVVPCATVTNVSDIVYKDNDGIGYDVELSAEPDSTGNTHYEYIKSQGAA